MLRIVTTILLSAFAIPALAAPVSTHLVTPEGEQYRYTTELRGDVVAIRGEILDTGERIDLTVNRRGRVDGTIGHSPVSFWVPQRKRDAIVAQFGDPAVAAVAPAAEAQLAASR